METKIGKWTSFVVKNYILIILFFLILAFLSWFSIKDIQLQSDFSAILPQDYESVRLLKEISKRVGGLGMLSIGIETEDINAGKRFVEDLSLLLKKKLAGEIKSLENSAKEVKEHYQKYALLYLSKEDLIRLRNELKEWINRKKMELSPFYFSLEEEEEEFRFEDLKERYAKFLSRYETYIDGYYTGEGGKLFAIFIKPKYTPTDISNSRKFIKKVEEIINELNPRSYHASMKVGLAGNYKITVEEYDAVRRDIGSTFFLCVILIGGVVFLFFRRFRVLLLLTITLVSGILISFGILSIFMKKIVVMTGFLGSIIMGTAINYGIIQLARYFEERLEGKKVIEALDIAIHKTFLQTIASALTTVGGFIVLSFAVTRSFKEFGIMGSLGIIVCWALTYSLLPALLYLSEKIKPIEVFTTGWRKPMFFIPSKVSDRIAYYYKPVLLVFLPLAIYSCVLFIKFIPRSLEYNFENLRSKMSLRSGTAVLDERISKILKKSTTPAIIPVENMEEGKEVCEVLKEDSLKGKTGDCVNIYSLLPDDQERKMKIIKDIYNLIKNIDENWLDEEKAEELKRFKKLFEEVRPFAINELPEVLLNQFSDAEGNIGTLVYVMPYPGKYLWDAKNLFEFTDSLRKIKLPNGKIIKTSGEAIIFADILKSIQRDAPSLSILAFITITIFVLLTFRNLKDTFYILTSLICALSWMFGLIALFNFKFNFLNFVAIPTAMGTGVDYAINVYQRARIDGRKGMGYVLHRTGSAVLLCSLTTMIGYFVLITADTQILASYGEIAIIAEFSCIFSALFLLTALLRFLKKLPP